MKAIKCEMCDSTDIVKRDELYVCQSCGTKYEPEAAKKLMIEIDNTDQMKKIQELARRAREEGNNENALKYYTQLVEDDPDDWEAYLYCAIFKAKGTSVAGISTAANQLASAINTTFKVISAKEEITEDDVTTLDCACGEAVAFSEDALLAAHNSYIGFLKISDETGLEHYGEELDRAYACNSVLKAIGNGLEDNFDLDDPSCKELRLVVGQTWANLVDSMDLIEGATTLTTRNEYAEKANRYQPGKYVEKVKRSTEASTGGCYVATCVYGSYDCPQVWTLRRYRDHELAKTKTGRAFIKAYYAISPTLVQWFGETKWFKRMWQGSLDRLVAKCKAKGFEDTPYQDRNW